MPILDDVLDKPPAGAVPSHPRLKDWAERIQQTGEKPTLEVSRPTAGFGAGQPEMCLQFTDKGVPQSGEILAWDDDLNAGLIELGVRAIDEANEAERFALGLRAALRKAGREFGDGYFNAVLYDLVTESGLSRDPEIAEVIKHANALSPERNGKSYPYCRDMIAFAIAGRRHELEASLHYPAAEARQILVHALARYLDERFSVSSRRRLGLL
jgi:hypothetical protein